LIGTHYKLFNINKNTVFSARGRFYVILNQDVQFQEVVKKVRWEKVGIVYNKSLDALREDVVKGVVSYEGIYDDTPDDFNMVIGLVFYSVEKDKYFVVIGGGMRGGEDTTRFVEAERTGFGWTKNMDTIYNLLDSDIKKKQAENLLWNVGVFDRSVELL